MLANSLIRVRGYRTTLVDQRRILVLHTGIAGVLPLARLCVEVIQALRKARAISHRAGDPKVRSSHRGLLRA